MTDENADGVDAREMAMLAPSLVRMTLTWRSQKKKMPVTMREAQKMKQELLLKSMEHVTPGQPASLPLLRSYGYFEPSPQSRPGSLQLTRRTATAGQRRQGGLTDRFPGASPKRPAGRGGGANTAVLVRRPR